MSAVDVGVDVARELGVDWEAEVPCQVKDHDHAADLLIGAWCRRCGRRPSLTCCWAWWDYLGSTVDGTLVACHCCGWAAPRDAMVRILEVLRAR